MDKEDKGTVRTNVSYNFICFCYPIQNHIFNDNVSPLQTFLSLNIFGVLFKGWEGGGGVHYKLEAKVKTQAKVTRRPRFPIYGC